MFVGGGGSGVQCLFIGCFSTCTLLHTTFTDKIESPKLSAYDKIVHMIKIMCS